MDTVESENSVQDEDIKVHMNASTSKSFNIQIL